MGRSRREKLHVEDVAVGGVSGANDGGEMGPAKATFGERFGAIQAVVVQLETRSLQRCSSPDGSILLDA